MNESDTQKEAETTTGVTPESETTEQATETTPEVIEVIAETVETNAETLSVVAEEVVAVVPATESAPEPTPATETAATTAVAASVVAGFKKAKDFAVRKKYTLATLLLVVVALLALVYALEDKGKLQTGIFDDVRKEVSKYTPAAKVNEEAISKYDLGISVTQLSAGAAAQGADLADPTVQDELETQALDMLINTELLKQEAASRGLAVTEEEVTARLETLKTDVGGEEVLNQRLKDFGIKKKTLMRDIRNELTIQKLLDEVFKEKEIAVSDAEIADFYEKAGGAQAGLPALEEVKAQIEAQLKASKQQGVVTSLIEELRTKAQIEILI